MPDDNNNPNPNPPSGPTDFPSGSPAKTVVEEVPTIAPPPSAPGGDINADIPPPPSIPGASPPVIDDRDKSSEKEAEDQKANNLDLPPVIAGGAEKPKKGGGRRVIATILGLFLLVGGIGAGVVLVQRQQDIREKAAIEDGSSGQPGVKCSVGVSTEACKGKDVGYVCGNNRICTGPIVSTDLADCSCVEKTSGGGTGEVVDECQNVNKCGTAALTCGQGKICASTASGNKCINSTQCLAILDSDGDGIINSEDACPDQKGTVEFSGCPSGSETNCSTYQEDICSIKFGGVCISAVSACLNGYENHGFAGCNDGDVCVTAIGTGDGSTGDGGSSGGGTSPTGTPTPTNPPPGGTVTAQCLNIRAYDADWNELTTTQLGELSAGDTVRFTVAGSTNYGSIQKARFIINGVTRAEVTQKKPSTNEFYDEYTIPEGTTTFSVRAQLFHSAGVWF